MKTPQQIRNEVEKEIINDFRYQWDKDGNDENSPDMSEEDIVSGLYLWCEGFLVKAIPKILTEYDKAMKEMIEGLYLSKCKEQGLDKSEWTEAEMFSLNELLSKIGDNSNSENWDSGDTCVYEGDNSEVEK